MPTATRDIPAAEIALARQVHPADFLPADAEITSRGSGGRLEVSVGGQNYRITPAKSGDAWLAFSKNNPPLDPIRLHQLWYNSSFATAVQALNNPERSNQPAAVRRAENQKRLRAATVIPAEPHADFKLPTPSPSRRDVGRVYLQCRCISRDTLDHAESAGFLMYSGYCNGAVLFVARDSNGIARAAEQRIINPEPDTPKSQTLPGSQKRFFPAVLPGENDKTVYVVEGGVDALAAHDLAKQRKQPTPTVIATGGAALVDQFNTPHIKAILQKADKVVVCCEREKSEHIQARTDKQHDKQKAAIREINPSARVGKWYPPHGKDLAEMLEIEIDRLVPEIPDISL